MFGILDHGGGQVGARVEEVVLNLPHHVENLLAGVAQRYRHTDGGVCLVAVGIRGEARVTL